MSDLRSCSSGYKEVISQSCSAQCNLVRLSDTVQSVFDRVLLYFQFVTVQSVSDHVIQINIVDVRLKAVS